MPLFALIILKAMYSKSNGCMYSPIESPIYYHRYNWHFPVLRFWYENEYILWIPLYRSELELRRRLCISLSSKYITKYTMHRLTGIVSRSVAYTECLLKCELEIKRQHTHCSLFIWCVKMSKEKAEFKLENAQAP